MCMSYFILCQVELGRGQRHEEMLDSLSYMISCGDWMLSFETNKKQKCNQNPKNTCTLYVQGNS